VNVRARLDRFFFEPASPTNLGVARAALFLFVGWWALQENVTRDAALARVNWRPTSYFRLLGGPPSAGTLRAIQVALVVSAVLAAAGLFTRAAQLIATPLAAYLLGFDSNFGKINHRSMLVVLLLLALLPARLGDGCSIDRLRAAARTKDGSPPPPDPRYRWPLALAQVCAVSVYFFAGISKLVNGGPAWFGADSFRRFLYVRLDQLASPPRAGLWLAGHPGLAQLAAIASVALELSVVFILFWPRLKAFVLPGIVLFHEMTRALVRIDFTRTMLAAMAPLIDYRAIGVQIRERANRPRFILLMDGACSMCRRTAAVLKAADAVDRIEVADARDDAMVVSLGIDPARAVDEMHLVAASGRAYAGFDAYRRLAFLLPASWALAPFLYIPGMRAIGRRAYRRISRSRLPVLHCTSASCTIGERAGSAIVPTSRGE
jgi:predicted DCC family thiol-disulfide oxidoreductase YuxK